MTTEEKLREAISSYYRHEFGEPATDEDFENPACVGLAYTTTLDDEHEIQVSLNLHEPALVYEIDGERIYAAVFSGLDGLLTMVGEDGLGLSFDTMVSEAEDIWRKNVSLDNTVGGLQKT